MMKYDENTCLILISDSYAPSPPASDVSILISKFESLRRRGCKVCFKCYFINNYPNLVTKPFHTFEKMCKDLGKAAGMTNKIKMGTPHSFKN